MATQVQEVMSAEPVMLDVHASVADAAKAMRDTDAGAMLVCDGDRLQGLVTDRDIVVRAIADGRDPSKVEVSQISSSEIGSLKPDDDVGRAVQLMRERHVRRIPVIDGDRPVGIVSIGDLALALDERSALADISAAPGNV